MTASRIAAGMSLETQTSSGRLGPASRDPAADGAGKTPARAGRARGRRPSWWTFTRARSWAGRAVVSADPRASPHSKNWLACSAAWSASPPSSPPRAGARTSSKSARPAPKITPELYLACGISGAIQHIADCAGAKHIIAINTDADAPILAHADYAIIGDLHKVIPALVAALRAR